jgi:hypothetical protein
MGGMEWSRYTIIMTDDRYAEAPESILVEATHNAIRDLARRKLAESGGNWTGLVQGTSLTRSEVEGVERRLLDSGYRFAWSSTLSLRDRPEIYASADGALDDATFSFRHPAAVVAPPDEVGREQKGVGDNVVQFAANVMGTALYVRTSDKVLQLMRGGVGKDTIAIIDDSGGTLTAPILSQFVAVICAGGTVRSHLGILTREYGIPCLMNAKLSDIRSGDRIELETSALARPVETYQTGEEVPARIWKLP